MEKEKPDIIKKELTDELSILQNKFNELTAELKRGCGIYEQETWDERAEVVRRMSVIKKLI